MKIKLPGWVMSPGDAIQNRLPSREDVTYRLLGTHRGRLGMVGAAYVVMISIYLGGNIPYPAIGQEGWIAQYALSSVERGALAWFMIAVPPFYYVEKRALSYVYSPDKNYLLSLDPEGEKLEMWNLGDETLGDMDVEGGRLASRRTSEGKIWLALDYDPAENLARPTWEGTIDAGQVWTTKRKVHKSLTETHEAARERDRMKRNMPEMVHDSVNEELVAFVEEMENVGMSLETDAWSEELAERLGLEYEDVSGEKEEEIRKQRDEKERKNGDVSEVEAFGASSTNGEV